MNEALYAFALVGGVVTSPLPEGPDGGQVEALPTSLGTILIQRIGPEAVARLKAAENAMGLRSVTDWLLFHERIGTLAARAGPVYPFSFATVFSSDDVLRQELMEQSDTLSAYLTHVTDADEWAIKICNNKSKETRTDDAAQATSGLDYLRRRKARAESDARTELAMQIEHAVAPMRHYARDWRTLRNGLATAPGRAVVGTFAALVDRTEADAFSREARASIEAAMPDFDISVTGPWPPFSFRPTMKS